MQMDNIAVQALIVAIGYIVPVVEACGVIVIVLEVVRTVVMHISTFFRRGANNSTQLRMRLGQSMVAGLEFLVAADILKTAISPSWNEMLLLAALIGLRTLLNYLLERELQVLDEQCAALANGDAQPENQPLSISGQTSEVRS